MFPHVIQCFHQCIAAQAAIAQYHRLVGLNNKHLFKFKHWLILQYNHLGLEFSYQKGFKYKFDIFTRYTHLFFLKFVSFAGFAHSWKLLDLW